MMRRLPLLLLVLLPLACAKDDSGPVDAGFKVFQVPGERSLGEAVAAAQPGDRIVLTPPGSWQGDIILPPNVDLRRHDDFELPDLFLLEGQLRVTGAEEGTLIEGLEIVNDAGSGLVLSNCVLDVRNCWIHDCAGPGIELIGRCGTNIQEGDVERCSPGILIRDVSSTGHWEDDTAPRLSNLNFLDNLDHPGGLGPNLVFQNIAAWDSVYVRWNYWGATPGEVDPADTVWDYTDNAAIRGVADVREGFSASVEPLYRDWHD